MPKIRVGTILKILFVVPIRVAIRYIKFLIDFISNVFLGGFVSLPPPFNFIFPLFTFLSIVLLFISYVWTEPFVAVGILYSSITVLFNNVQLLAQNQIIIFLWDWGVPIINDSLYFGEVFIDMVWNGVCGGAEGYSDYADCTGFANLLIVIELITDSLFHTLSVLSFLLRYLFAIILEISCTDLQCSNVCGDDQCITPATRRSFSMVEFEYDQRINFVPTNWISQSLLAVEISSGYQRRRRQLNEDEFTLNEFTLKEFGQDPGRQRRQINEEELVLREFRHKATIYVAQILANIAIAIFQWLIEVFFEIFLVINVFWLDLSTMLFVYFTDLLIELGRLFTGLFKTLIFIFVRSVRIVEYNAEEDSLVINPEYWEYNHTTWKNDLPDSIVEEALEDNILNATDFFLYNSNIPNPYNMKTTAIKALLFINNYIVFWISVPMVLFNIADRVLCIILNPLTCFGLDKFLCELFRPDTVCFVFIPAVYHSAYNEYSYSGELIMLDLVDVMIDLPQGGNIQNSEKCIDYETGQIYDDWITHPSGQMWTNISCLYGDMETISGSSHQKRCSAFDFCDNIYNPSSYETSCKYCLDTLVDFSEYGDIVDYDFSDVNPQARICGDTFLIKRGGPLFPWKKDPLRHFLFIALDALGPFVNDIWSEMMNAVRHFYFECKAATQDICPCNKCKAASSQFILKVLDDIFAFFGFEPGWTFNLDHPDPSKTCVVVSPYLSMIYVADAIFEFLGLDLVKQEDIKITR